MTRALVVVGGWAHPAEQTGPPTRAALGALGLDVEAVDTMDGAAAALTGGAVDLLVVHTCRFMMLDARYSDAQRAELRYLTPPPVRDAISGHVAAGRPVLAMHTAPLCFDDWPEWSTIVGARWDWQRSNHPPPGAFRVDPAVVTGLAPFTVVDELYRFVSPAVDAEILATAVDADGIVQPLAWRHHAGPTRVAYDSLGHDHRSLEHPGHRDLLAHLVAWLLGGP